MSKTPSGSTVVHAFGCLDDKMDLRDSQQLQIWQMAQGKVPNYRDNITGQPFEDELVVAAPPKVLEYFNSKSVWEMRPWAEARH